MKRQIKINPDNKLAKLEDLKRLKFKFDQSPITVDGHSFDADDKSLAVMADIVDHFADLNKSKIDWILSDNTSISVTKDQLSNILTQLKKLKSIRSYQINVKYQEFKNNPPLLKDAKNKDNWK